MTFAEARVALLLEAEERYGASRRAQAYAAKASEDAAFSAAAAVVGGPQ